MSSLSSTFSWSAVVTVNDVTRHDEVFNSKENYQVPPLPVYAEGRFNQTQHMPTSRKKT